MILTAGRSDRLDSTRLDPIQGTEPSREMYTAFVKKMGEMYKPVMVKGGYPPPPFRARVASALARPARGLTDV